MFDHLDNAELEDILRQTARSDKLNDADTDYALLVLEVLEKRLENDPNEQLPDVEAAWESFKKNYLPYIGSAESIYDWGFDDEDDIENKDAHNLATGRLSRKTGALRPRRFKRVVALAAIFVIMAALTLFFTVTAAGKSHVRTIIQIGRERYSFVASIFPEPINDDLANLRKLIKDHGIYERLVPSWLPPGFGLVDFEIIKMPSHTTFCSQYESGPDSLFIKITSQNDVSEIYYEISDEYYDLYHRNEVDHYIIKNKNIINISWIYKHYECLIAGDITLGDAYAIINSIYER